MTGPTSYTSHWKRAPGRALRATRADGACTVKVTDYKLLEQRIFDADVSCPPAGWVYRDLDSVHSWSFGPWSVVATAAIHPGTHELMPPWRQEWVLSRGGEKFTKRPFRTADRARHYAEMRLSRSSGAQRGPRARNATASLPDVRATPGERSAAFETAADLGLTYSELIRASLKLVKALHDSGQLQVADKGFAIEGV